MDAKKLAERLAWHAVAYQSVATAEKGADELHEAARETLYVTADALAAVLPIEEQIKIANELPRSELEAELGEWKPYGKEEPDLNDLIRAVFVARLEEYVEAELLPAYVSERASEPKKRIEMP